MCIYAHIHTDRQAECIVFYGLSITVWYLSPPFPSEPLPLN